MWLVQLRDSIFKFCSILTNLKLNHHMQLVATILDSEKWNISCISVNKDVTIVSSCSRHEPWAGEPWGNSGRKECLPSSSLRTSTTPYSGTWRSSECGPNRWGAYQRNDFSDLQLLLLPIHRKALNTLTWGIYFSLINNNLLNVLVTCPSMQNLYISWLLPSSLQSSSLRVTWGSVSQTQSPKISLQCF